jgi:hypothetical protein
MPIPDNFRLRLNLYTLACQQLLTRLEALRASIEVGTHFDCTYCIHAFDEAIRKTLRDCNSPDPAHISEQFFDFLKGNLRALSNGNSKHAADIMEDLCNVISRQLPSWSYENNFEQFHAQGRELARDFFKSSRFEETQQCLNRACQLRYTFPAGNVDDGSRELEPFGYHAAPAAYRPRHFCEDTGAELDDVILLRIQSKSDFDLYLSYPFFFLHEYTAHVYATGASELFNEGWMLYAAFAHMLRRWAKDSYPSDLHREQVDVFPKVHLDRLERLSRVGYETASQFDEWLRLGLGNSTAFEEVTYELAALNPSSPGSPCFQTAFIHAIRRSLGADKARLGKKIGSSQSVVQLLDELQRD